MSGFVILVSVLFGSFAVPFPSAMVSLTLRAITSNCVQMETTVPGDIVGFAMLLFNFATLGATLRDARPLEATPF